MLLLPITGSTKVSCNQIPCRHQGESVGFLCKRHRAVSSCQVEGDYIVYIRFSPVFFLARHDPFDAVRRGDRIWASQVSNPNSVVLLFSLTRFQERDYP